MGVANHVDAAAEVRVDRGISDSHGLALAMVGVGAEVRPSTMLAVAAFALALEPLAARDDGVRAKGGAGGELAIAVRPFTWGPVRPFARLSAGLLAFPRRPFLPMGDVYDFVLHAGLGVDVRLTPRVVLALHVDRAHLSNGQGLVPENPSFNGVGAGIDVAYALAEPEDRPAALRVPSGGGALEVDGELANADGWLGAGRARAGMELRCGLRGQLDVEAGALAGHAFGEVGLDLVTAGERGLIAVHAGAREFAGIHGGVVQAQGELAVAPQASILVTGLWEPSSYVGALVAAAGLRMRPHRDVAIDVGEAIDHAIGGGTDHALFLGAEWRIGAPAIFLERQLSGVNLIGVRYTAGAGDVWGRLR